MLRPLALLLLLSCAPALALASTYAVTVTSNPTRFAN
jgi:hypothetical protein